MANENYKWINFSSSKNHSLPGYTHNVKFPIRVWPQSGSNPARGIVVMVNGFLEGLTQGGGEIKFPEHYNAIAETLSKQNYIVVLMPLPFHFERSFDFPSEGPLAPILRLDNSIGGNGSFVFFGGYTQLKEDIHHLCKLFKQKSKPGFDEFNISNTPEYHLLGYSLGGVMTLGMLIEDEGPVKFNSTSILLSNYNISDITPNQINNNLGLKLMGFTGEIWSRVIGDLKKSKKSLPAFFRFLIWGENQSIFKQKLVELGNISKNKQPRLLFLNGMQDDLFDFKKINRRNNDLFDLIMKNENIKTIVTLIMTSSKHRIQKTGLIAEYVSAFISNK